MSDDNKAPAASRESRWVWDEGDVRVTPPPNTRLDGEVELPIWECQQCGHPRYAPIQPEACEHCGAPRPKRVWPGSDRS